MLVASGCAHICGELRTVHSHPTTHSSEVDAELSVWQPSVSELLGALQLFPGVPRPLHLSDYEPL